MLRGCAARVYIATGKHIYLPTSPPLPQHPRPLRCACHLPPARGCREMRFRKKRAESTQARPGSETEGLPADSVSQRKRSRSSKRKAKAPLRIVSAIASHSLDAALALSDSLGPLKAPVTSVGHARDIWENVTRTTQDARNLRSEIETFRTRLQAVVPIPMKSESEEKTFDYFIDSLTPLDKELDDIETWIEQLLGERVGSRILHWKQFDCELKSAQARFQSSKDTFSITSTFLSSTLLLRMHKGDLDVPVHHLEKTEQNHKQIIKNFNDLRRVVILLSLVPASLFDYGM
ncbi:hypothetical protein SCHPADRAFT_127661 [Schizopora paradoxa]|uniref:Uncharacterized protein n=1 Tax=Schizopora paradoxa TaxID=27342 RepID=A0A0H2S2L4_9AGAM|nr:hypothetical protein SCHPADRAFT_127661 [Schizopora paradoxa]